MHKFSKKYKKICKSGLKWLEVVKVCAKIVLVKEKCEKVFLGEFEYKCDSKNRFRLPVKFKKNIDGSIVLTKGSSGCIYVMQESVFQEFVNKASQLPMFDLDAQKPLRLLFSSASLLEEDGQGRYLLPSNLKNYAGINSEIVFIGTGNKIELWAKEKWQEYLKKEQGNFDELLQGLSKYGI